MHSIHASGAARPGRLQRLLNLRAGETGPVLVAALLFFLVLTALMLLRPARDALGMERGIENIRWLFLGTALVTLATNPLFGWLASRLRRLSLVAVTYGFFVLSLVGFWVLLMFAPQAVGRASGQVFYVWFSVFNLFVTMVFWALMADRFSRDQAKRLFALISVGGTLGAIAGPWLTSQLAQPLGTASLLIIAGALLVLAVAAAWWLFHLSSDHAYQDTAGTAAATSSTRIGGDAWAGLRQVFRSRYLMGIAGYILLMTLLATLIYFTRLQMVAAAAQDMDARAAMLGNIDMWTQVAVLVLQLTLTGKIIGRFGLGVALALLPAATAIGFIGLAVYGSFAVLILLEASNRAVQRGITRPAREALFTVLPREEKYKAKAFLDTFVYRSGDVIGAQVEGLLGRLGMAMGSLIGVVIPLSLLWAALGLWLGRAQARASAATDPPPPPSHRTAAPPERHPLHSASPRRPTPVPGDHA